MSGPETRIQDGKAQVQETEGRAAEDQKQCETVDEFITSTLKSLAIRVIWLALSSVIYS